MNIRLLIAFLVVLLAQNKAHAEIITEDDGFVWEKFHTPGIDGDGVKDRNGNIIISPIKGATIRYRKATFGSSLSIGYFWIEVWNGKKFLSGISDVKGNIKLKPKYDFATFSVRMCNNDTIAYYYVSNENNTEEIFDLNVKRIAKHNNPISIDDQGELIDFKTKKSLGKRLLPSNNGLSSFYIRKPIETINTPWGQFHATPKKSGDFEWKLLTLSNNTICEAMDPNNKVLVPVSDKLVDLKYNNGVFIGRQSGPEGFSVAYDSIGNPLISIVDSLNHLQFEKGYFIGSRSNCDFKTETMVLFDKAGNVLIPPDHFKSISMPPCSYTEHAPYFIGLNDRAPYTVVFNKNLSPILELKDYNIGSVSLEADSLGIYYTYSVDGKRGILSENGNIVIPAGKYDIVKRNVRHGIGYYDVTVNITSKDKLNDFKHGICALNGEELIAPEYSYIVNSGGIVEITDFNGKKYSYNGDLTAANKCEIVKENGLYYLCTPNGVKLNKCGYNTLDYDEDKFSYLASIGEYTTYVGPTGVEQAPIFNQIFDKAFSIAKNNPSDALSLYSYLIDLDKDCSNSSLLSQCYNNIGVIYNKQGYNEKAIANFRKAIELAPTNTIASNNLDELLSNKLDHGQDEGISGWDIALNFLGIISDAYSTYNSVSNNENRDNVSDGNDSYVHNSKNKRNHEKQVNVVAKCNNKRNADRTYNNYVSQLSDMNVWRERHYNDSQRRQIQSSMKSLRTKYGLTKSDWEDWDGSPR